MAQRLTLQGGQSLSGVCEIPGDKSLSHRALILGALAKGENQIKGWLDAGDTRATLGAMRALGLEIVQTGTQLTFKGGGLSAPAAPLDCANAGTAMRLLAGLLVWQHFPSTLDGNAQLRQRPMKRITEPLREMGARITAANEQAPLTIQPAALKGIDYTLPVASAQVKSALLLAALGAEGQTVIYEPGASRDHTERMLDAMGIAIHTAGRRITICAPEQPPAPLQMTIPGDISSAAFLLVAASILPKSDVTLRNVGLNPTRTGILDILSHMGADIQILDQWSSGGEPAGDLRVGSADLHGIEIDGGMVVRAIDELPVIAVAAALAKGETRICDAAELRVKEVDRIAVMVAGLRAMGVDCEERPDGMVIQGNEGLKGTLVSSVGDHRIGMAFAVAGLAAQGKTIIDDAGAMDDSFPGFGAALAALGAELA
jgi:3-phosphoshikimate 1-carboxyvinyltransferase